MWNISLNIYIYLFIILWEFTDKSIGEVLAGTPPVLSCYLFFSLFQVFHRKKRCWTTVLILHFIFIDMIGLNL